MRFFPAAGCLAVISLVAAPVRAQSTLDSACTAIEHRQFDFWIGEWTVLDSAGRELGVNRVTRIADNCGLREHWRGARGGEGMSLNIWQPATREWTQFWVGTGVVLRLTGGLDANGHMVLQGRREGPGGAQLDRVRWIPLDSGAVRQLWEGSRDGGASWQRVFDGYYKRKARRVIPARPDTVDRSRRHTNLARRMAMIRRTLLVPQHASWICTCRAQTRHETSQRRRRQ